MTTPQFREATPFTEAFLVECGFTDWRLIDGVIYAVSPYSIGNGRLFVDVDRSGYADFYCFCSPEAARQALYSWKSEQGEIQGWHRHGGSGRRRENGDPTKEQIYW